MAKWTTKHKLTLVLLKPDVSSLENSVDPDQLASDEAIWSGSALLSLQPHNPSDQLKSHNLASWNTVVNETY